MDFTVNIFIIIYINSKLIFEHENRKQNRYFSYISWEYCEHVVVVRQNNQFTVLVSLRKQYCKKMTYRNRQEIHRLMSRRFQYIRNVKQTYFKSNKDVSKPKIQHNRDTTFSAFNKENTGAFITSK